MTSTSTRDQEKLNKLHANHSETHMPLKLNTGQQKSSLSNFIQRYTVLMNSLQHIWRHSQEDPILLLSMEAPLPSSPSNISIVTSCKKSLSLEQISNVLDKRHLIQLTTLQGLITVSFLFDSFCHVCIARLHRWMYISHENVKCSTVARTQLLTGKAIKNNSISKMFLI